MIRVAVGIRTLRTDEKGAGAVEFALAAPVFILFIWGLFQACLVLLASAGTQNALGEGARKATVYVAANSGPPSDSEIQTAITSHKFGVGNGTWSTPTIVTDSVNGTKTITVTYSQPTDFLFFKGPNVSITKSKVVNISTS
jgi:Flp pilus assembly protein TadG